MGDIESVVGDMGDQVNEYNEKVLDDSQLDMTNPANVTQLQLDTTNYQNALRLQSQFINMLKTTTQAEIQNI